MKTFFGRIGNKTRMINDILKLIPQHKTYIEPFVGSGAVLFAKPPSEKEIINDLDTDVYNNFRLLKNASTDPKKYNIRQTLNEQQLLVNSSPSSKQDILLKAMYLTCNTFAGKVSNKLYGNYSGSAKIQNIKEYVNRLKKVKIYNKDYKTFLTKYDSNESFFFLDPPYQGSKSLYKNHNLDYEELHKLLSSIKGFFMLTLNDSEYLRTLFKDYYIKTITLKSVGGITIGRKPRQEIIIMNYIIK